MAGPSKEPGKRHIDSLMSEVTGGGQVQAATPECLPYVGSSGCAWHAQHSIVVGLQLELAGALCC